MKRLTNTSLQSWNIYLQTEEGVKSFYLAPEQSIQVPASYITDDVIRYQQRSLISIKNA
jgi:hypothetical protein